MIKTYRFINYLRNLSYFCLNPILNLLIVLHLALTLGCLLNFLSLKLIFYLQFFLIIKQYCHLVLYKCCFHKFRLIINQYFGHFPIDAIIQFVSSNWFLLNYFANLDFLLVNLNTINYFIPYYSHNYQLNSHSYANPLLSMTLFCYQLAPLIILSR